jgi:hypothetical protein
MPIAFFRNLQNLDPREIEKWPYLGCAAKTHEKARNMSVDANGV